MDGPGADVDKVIGFLVRHARCTECGARYDAENVHVIEHTDLYVWDLAAVCHSCYTLSVVRAVVRPPDRDVEAPSIEPVPASTRRALQARWHELTPAEAKRFRRLPPVDTDDVLDVTEFLRSFDGDFRGLFGQEPDEG